MRFTLAYCQVWSVHHKPPGLQPYPGLMAGSTCPHLDIRTHLNTAAPVLTPWIMAD